MAEGPEVKRIADRLREELKGKRIRSVDAPPAMRAQLGPRLPRLRGRRVRTAYARGKYLLLEFSTGEVLLHHMRVWGHWTFWPRGTASPWHRPRRRLRLELSTDDVRACLWDAPVVKLLSPTELAAHPQLAAQGPDGLAELFDEEVFLRRLADPRRAREEISTAILDQQVVAGVGNMYKAEILFRCGLHPRTPVGRLNRSARHRLARAIPKILRQAYKQPVWYVPAARAAAGPGKALLQIYGRAGQPCLRCGTRIRRVLQGAWKRVTFYCPRCQPAVS
ncbi:MAG: Fpg/Nei family DNA glycosylase [Terriglobia bacterium]